MLKVYFKNSRGERKFLAEVEGTLSDTAKAWEVVKDFLSNYPHFKVYYVRNILCEDKKEICWDVGSHTEFFFVREE